MRMFASSYFFTARSMPLMKSLSLNDSRSSSRSILSLTFKVLEVFSKASVSPEMSEFLP